MYEMTRRHRILHVFCLLIFKFNVYEARTENIQCMPIIIAVADDVVVVTVVAVVFAEIISKKTMYNSIFGH